MSENEDAKDLRKEPKEKFIYFYEAAKRSLLAAEHLFARLDEELTQLEQIISDGEEVNERIVPALLSSISLVDFCHRYCELLEDLPLISEKKKRSIYKNLRELRKPIEASRHHLQHLRGDLGTNAPIDYPLLGSIAWIRNNINFVIGLGLGSANVTMAGMVFDTWNRCFVANFEYRVADISVRFDPLLKEMRTVFDVLAERVEFSDPTFDKYGWGKTIAVQIALATSVQALPSEVRRIIVASSAETLEN